MEKINFQNGASGKTPLNATNLNKMQDNIENGINNLGTEINNKEVVLYNNASGTTGSITLSEDISNFKKIEVFYRDDWVMKKSDSIYNPSNGDIMQLLLCRITDENSAFMRSSAIKLEGKSITKQTTRCGTWNSWNNSIEIKDLIYIYKVVGYK